MNRAQFLADPDVAGFLDFFSCCLHHLEVDYQSNYTRILPADQHFHVTGVAAAHANYAWPGENTFIGPPHPRIYDWVSTSGFLGTARTALRGAISVGNDPDTWNAVKKILEWGLNPNAVANNLTRLHQLYLGRPGRSISAYLGGIQGALNLAVLDTGNINAGLLPYASSGMSKVHSLASSDGLIIFDSRVAATVGECINEYLRRGRYATIPPTLMIYREPRPQRTPLPLHGGGNHPIFIRDHRWIECQVRVSWMFEEVLARNPAIFPGLPMPDRMHCLEAACFMMGAYLQPGPFAGRSFNFSRC
jgi:hypothetical protein